MPTPLERLPAFQRAQSVIDSFRYAGQGFAYALRTQRNLRVHMAVLGLVFVMAYWLQVSAVRWGILLVVASLVIMAELFNTAIEVTIDLVSPDFHPMAKIAKDIAAAGVLVAASLALVTGLVIFGPALLFRLTGISLGF